MESETNSSSSSSSSSTTTTRNQTEQSVISNPEPPMEPMEQDNPNGTLSRTQPNTNMNKDKRHSSSEESDSYCGSEFEPNDHADQFELWSSDETSPDEEEEPDDATTTYANEDDAVVSSKSSSLKHIWSDTIKKQNIVPLKFSGVPGLMGLDPDRKYTALECFKLFVDDDLINLMVQETNKYARSKFIRYGYHQGFLSGWLDVNFKEMTQFIALIIFMSLKRLPVTDLYWSTGRLYFNTVACRVFTQTRFYRILKFWHFGTDGTNSTHAKVNPVIDRLNANFRKYKQPGNILYVGRSTVYLRNKYVFDAHAIQGPKKGSKILKVMDQDVYTYKIKILCPGSSDKDATKTNVVDLLDGYLGFGRLVIFHNLWISLELAEELLKRKSHSIGMIRKNSRGAPKELETKQLQDGDLIGFQNNEGVSVMKWQLLGASYYGISTCHTLETVTIHKRNSSSSSRNQELPEDMPTTNPNQPPVEEQVPRYLRDISLSERIFDAHDKFSVNHFSLNEHIKWDQRIACDAIINPAVTNALVLYKKLNKEKIRMWDFRDKLFRELVDIKQLPNTSSDEETEEPDLDD
ncbi:hypothetical protein ABEB36_001844 [Hypothenemus hampei]|uniref:PiggyBac transposable element-derived protein domain-containing protein n=1 Tax=Hypothenemus hampei TaxID=57062 RepID=A0ABD1FFX3_HYPHA